MNSELVDTMLEQQDRNYAMMESPSQASVIESVVVSGDLSKLTPEQRVSYYRQVCNSLGLNPLTRPFDYITLNGKLTLYARKDASEQLRRINKISIDKPDITFQEDWIIVSVLASTPDGRKDSDIGVVKKTDMRGDFGNAVMKAVTKAKRRVTLSICGLGMLDETEVETIPDAQPVVLTEVELPGNGVKNKPEPIAAPAAPIPAEQDAEQPIEQNTSPKPEQTNKQTTDPVAQIWPDELITHLIACNLGVKDPAKVPDMLNRSKIITPEIPRRFLEMWVNFYCQKRKQSKDETAAADDADGKVANLIAANGTH